MSCSRMFKMQPTDRGMCCSFNMDAAEKGYKESGYTESLMKLQTRDRELSIPFENEDQRERHKKFQQDLREFAKAWDVPVIFGVLKND